MKNLSLFILCAALFLSAMSLPADVTASQSDNTSVRAELNRAIAYYRADEDMKYDSAILISERLMLNDSVKLDTELQTEVLEVLLGACRMKQDNEQAMQWATQLCELYRSQGDETEALRTDAEVGTFLVRIGQQEEGLAKINDVINQLDGERSFNELDASIIALRRKVDVCYDMGLYDEMIVTSTRILDLLSDYEQHPVEYHDGSIREPADEKRPNYIDFYRGKGYAYLAMAYSCKGQRDESLKYLALFEQTSAGQGLTARFMMAPTLGRLGEYDKMLAVYDEVEQQLGADTINANYAEILKGRAEAAEARGQCVEANGYWKRYISLTDIINDELLQSKAHLYAARFKAQEQQREIERQREAAHLAIMVSVGIAIVGLLILLFAIYAVIEWRSTKNRNRILAFQITEALKYKEKYRELTQPQQVKSTTDEYADMTDEEIFAYLRDVIECENMYLDPNFDRQMLIKRTGVSKERINNENITNLVRELRLENAVRLMNEQPELTIEQVYQASGYTSADTFVRNFKAKYGMTPHAYRHTKA